MTFVALRSNLGGSDWLVTLLIESLNPWEPLVAEVPPVIMGNVLELLCSLIVGRECVGLFEQHVVGLLRHRWKNVHVLRAAMVSFLFRVCDCLTQTKSERVVIRALDTDAGVVLLKVVDLLDLLELVLKCVLNIHGQAAEVLIDILVELDELLVVARLKELGQLVKDHGHVEARKASLEAHLTAVLLHDDLLALILLIGVVELWNLADDPERLAVQLLLEVSVQQVSHLVLVAHNDERQEVTQ